MFILAFGSICSPLKAIAEPISLQEKDDLFPSNSCDCAEDLRGNYFQESQLKKPNLDTFQNNQFNQNNNNLFPQIQAQNSEITTVVDPNKWRFQFQPYVTVPLNTYGTATARGRTVDYDMNLGQILDSLNFTASARVEAWKGRFGLIFDGYYVNLGDTINLSKQANRTPSALNSLNYLMSKGTNTRVTELVNNLDQKIKIAKENEQLKKDEITKKIDTKIEDLKLTTNQDLEKLKTVDIKVEEIRNNLANFVDSRIGDLNFQDLENLKLTPEGFKELLALNIKDFPQIQDLEKLNQRIEETRVRKVLSSIPEVRHKLTETRDTIQQGIKTVIEERKIEDTEQLQALQKELEEAKILIDQELTKIEQTKDFIENRSPQNLDISSNSNLSFQQGIYDFAVSYHFGEIPNYRLPEKPSGRNYPILWFQPIAGMRLNNISINIEETINVIATSTLVNFNGSFQNNYGQTRTWLEPMIGAKLGMQLNDRIGLWLRGDASGFGLAGETDMSWNVLGGMDWWVGYNTALQLGYRFYEIDYSWGSGNNAFGFKESFNGPFLSATFHF
ncbi:hypothetical protein GM3708_1045 [Geminocystis sp. NIES-3708]|uniref:hypothetical protein n=1 Tax=Geminocystis sp. NIES-3708 TaxID=1615909 RepID=UPI0005FC83FC|nr:hypothetical protein [Geminocystis sp. NIES-3708]BAQ60639.1 hypothetical protein GM3708_1045 [Geminocystis sp. NIES-3708]